jgi:hypothetical protein
MFFYQNSNESGTDIIPTRPPKTYQSLELALVAHKREKEGYCRFLSLATIRCLFQFNECNAVLLVRFTLKVELKIEALEQRKAFHPTCCFISVRTRPILVRCLQTFDWPFRCRSIPVSLTAFLLFNSEHQTIRRRMSKFHDVFYCITSLKAL